ncbi:MAG: methyltransferase [Bacteroidetes bacterium]|nr:methyltransferase [Bacteroidota bacterium]
MSADSHTFYFKKFHLKHDRCAMKVGTDGVLLGAWAKAHLPKRVLDLGTGSGLIALMLAQRFPTATIDALEIDCQAATQAAENFKESAWNERICLINADFKDFEAQHNYDLIVCNPPFFPAQNPSPNAVRALARSVTHFSLAVFFQKCFEWLQPHGSLQLIFPFEDEELWRHQAMEAGFYVTYCTKVRGHENAPFKRMLTVFEKVEKPVTTDSLTIETNRHQYTDEYKSLTQAFYLNF